MKTESLTVAPAEKRHLAFNVWCGRKLLDTVFYAASANPDCAEVRRSLINHDGYPAEIVVRKAR
jgi:hypothetical protein